MMKILMRSLLCIVSAITVVSPAWSQESSLSTQEKGEIIGAGAHFSWIIFDELKPELEQKYGRKLKLYGKESMLGAGCNAGIKNAKTNSPANEAFGFVCCPLSEQEVKQEGLTVHPLALEPILILVNQSNPVTDIPLEKVRAIFKGEITNWKDVGGEDKPIVMVMRPHCSKRPGHWKTILPSLDLFRKDRLNVKSAAEMVRRVSDFPEAIGHTGATWIFGREDKVKAVTIGGVAPTAKNLKLGKYPFYRQLSAVTHGKVSDDLSQMLHEVQTGPSFRRVAQKYELVPMNKAQ